MSTEEREREEEITEGEGSESGIIVSSLEEEKEETRLPTVESPIQPTIKTKGTEFDDYNTDIMSSDSYIKSIPTIKAGITAAEFAVKEEAL
jgi:hypothetical protein